MCASLALSEGRMICKDCAEAAKYNAVMVQIKHDSRKNHPENCGCPCQHKPVGSWKGKK